MPPAIVLCNPKYAVNVGNVQRAAACFGVRQVWYTGSRVARDLKGLARIPREERMKGYADVTLINSDRPWDAFPRGTTIVGVELCDGSENLFDFAWPDDPVLVFGPEDGSLPKPVKALCHRFVTIPSAHCLNLASACAVALYDWRRSRAARGLDEILPVAAYLREHRGPVASPEDLASARAGAW